MQYPDQSALKKEYDELLDSRESAAEELSVRVSEAVHHLLSTPTIKARVKDFDSYYKKYIRLLKSDDSSLSPLIADIIGLRIVCPFLEDLATVEEVLNANFEVYEVQHKGGDHTFREFGYESVHLQIKLPLDLVKAGGLPAEEAAEIQIRTILQDAWAEVEHELVYKAEFNPLDEPIKRKLAAVNASLSLADIIFQEIRSYQRQLNGELEKRRDSFFRKIEESTDALLFSEAMPETREEIEEQLQPHYSSRASIDEMLLNALSAHNKRKFQQAIALYTQILEIDPEDDIKALILKHRGMAFFARSHYKDAIADFAKALELDPASHKAAYYKGIVHAVLRQYTEAVNSFNVSLKINPFQHYCLYRRGQAYYHLEDYPQALADCEASLALEYMEGAVKFKQLLLEKLNM
ncbi:MAG: tetratricopeptide repeat protein [Treponema sp.]|jgi:putative GTP pyrophosphokinase|nr:tetratricopeptide repeat protein [Treponema sp.]